MECSIKVPYKNTEYTMYGIEPISGEFHGNIMYMGGSLPERGWKISITLYHPHSVGHYRVFFTMQRDGAFCSQYVSIVDYDGRCPLVLTCENLATGKKAGRQQTVEMTATMEAFFKELFCKPRENGLTILPNPRMI